MKPEILEISLTQSEINLIRDSFSSIKYEPAGDKDYITALRMAAYRSFPARILSILEEQKRLKNPAPYILFKNLPIDEQITGSPFFSETGSTFKSGTLSENILCAFGSIIGEPYSIHFEGQELVNNLTPHKETKNDFSGLGSEVELDFHIENAALKHMSDEDCSPRGMFLLGIRRDDSGQGPKTYVADARQAIKNLCKEDIDVLYGKNFIIRLPYRWRNVFSGNNENTGLCSMISGPLELPRISAVFYPDMVLPVNDAAKKAFANLHEAVEQVSIGIEIKPGYLVYIDNRFALHSREKFKPTYDENNRAYRWLQRLFVTTSLWNFRAFPKSGERVFNPGSTN